MPKIETKVFMVGHSTRKLREFLQLMSAYDIKELVDVRTIPRSRANPQFNEKSLAAGLKRRHIIYKHMEGLGGLRHPSKDSVNTYWRNASFRGFADYMQTREFKNNITELVALAKKRRIALMCAEAVPWRCHRSLIADYLLIKGISVRHIFSATNLKEHGLTKSAKISGKNITYH